MITVEGNKCHIRGQHRGPTAATALSANPVIEKVPFYALGPTDPLGPSSESAGEVKGTLLGPSSLVSSHCPPGSSHFK